MIIIKLKDIRIKLCWMLHGCYQTSFHTQSQTNTTISFFKIIL